MRRNVSRLLALAGSILILLSLACNLGLSQQPDIEATVASGVQATQQAQSNVQATIDAAISATQASTGSQSSSDTTATDAAVVEPAATSAVFTPVATQSTTPADPAEQDAVRAVINAELKGAINQDLEALASLFAPNAVIIDHNGTPDDPSDNTIWQGWVNIERRYSAFFSAGFYSGSFVQLAVQVDGDRAQGTHQGVVLDDVYYEDSGLYLLEKQEGRWLITQLEYGNRSEDGDSRPTVVGRDDGLYVLELGGQHRYEEPWGWDRGDPCQAWQTGNFDDTKPNYRGFNIELLLTNNSDEKIPDEWPITFTTAKGQLVKACYYDYEGSGPEPETTNSVTFFTVVEQGDYVETITFALDDQVIRLCLDGQGGAVRC